MREGQIDDGSQNLPDPSKPEQFSKLYNEVEFSKAPRHKWDQPFDYEAKDGTEAILPPFMIEDIAIKFKKWMKGDPKWREPDDPRKMTREELMRQ